MPNAKVTLYLVASTDNAYLFCVDKDKSEVSFWIPRSLIDYIRKDPPRSGKLTECHLEIPTWKAEELDLEDES